MSNKKINVLQFICPTGFYGAERWVLALANNLDPKSVRCDLVVTEESPDQDLELLKQYPDVEGSTFKIGMRNRFDTSAIAQLCDLIRERNIHIIHTHGYKSDILGFIAAKRCGIPCISTPHGFGVPSSFKLKVFIRVGSYFLRFFDRVIPLSQQLYNECAEFGVPNAKLSYIQNGVDLKEVEEFRLAKKEPKIKKEKKVIGFIGQMIPRKMVAHILEVFDLLCETDDNLTLQLLGDGESRVELEELAKGLASSSKVEFLGFRTDRLEILRNFDLFVMSSSDEGIPRCLMEAMAMGTPVAAYDIPGIDQLLSHEETALLAPFGDKAALLDCWRELLSNHEKAEALSEKSREFVQKHFSAARMSQEYLDVFQQLVDVEKVVG